ncbi:VOC family protein [Vibrio nigripulchritudo]|uniref:VOC family protein n=1 Tax=Vibrio nigripulchritudo TaxID=28173 RepID=UPI0003B2184D|nr:VOC family protein [Vibrio nigripulchritudo]CCN73191.1 putative Glyoxalase/Bleomycin resistance protein/Dihydroxybiphenyl dioxygenase [Vibrio nigripulchritudo SFn118]
MSTYVEHANVTVNNIERAIAFLQTALPDFEIRHQGKNQYRWCHIGTDSTYIALQEGNINEDDNRTPYRHVGINHIGFVVDDADEVQRRLVEQGYRQNDMETEHPFRKRLYFYDHDGMEWEFVQYLSENPSERNDYLYPNTPNT